MRAPGGVARAHGSVTVTAVADVAGSVASPAARASPWAAGDMSTSIAANTAVRADRNWIRDLYKEAPPGIELARAAHGGAAGRGAAVPSVRAECPSNNAELRTNPANPTRDV